MKQRNTADISEVLYKKLYSILTQPMKDNSFQFFGGDADPGLFPGLFQGSSGVGYTALRFIDHQIPSLSGLQLGQEDGL